MLSRAKNEHTVAQIGMLGYPLTPLYGMFFIAVAIYVYYWMLRVLSRPMDRRWMQSNRSVFYLTLLGVMLVVIVAVILGISVVYVFTAFVISPMRLHRYSRELSLGVLFLGDY